MELNVAGMTTPETCTDHAAELEQTEQPEEADRRDIQACVVGLSGHLADFIMPHPSYGIDLKACIKSALGLPKRSQTLIVGEGCAGRVLRPSEILPGALDGGQPLIVTVVVHDETKCGRCGSKKKLKACSGCLDVYYCSRACQNAHWKEHKPDCHTWKSPNG